MNSEAEKEMARDVEENEEMYQALADEPDKTTIKVPAYVLGYGNATVTVELDEGTSQLLDEQFVKKKTEQFAKELADELKECREVRE
jgi:hypothetical protein